MRKAGKVNPYAAVLLGCLFALMLYLNFRTFLTADDFIFTLHRLYFRPIQSVPDIVDSLRTLRRNVNGRVIAHFFAQLFLFWPKPIFNFVNAGNCTLLFYLLYCYIRRGERRRDACALLFLLAAVWLLLPAFGQVFLWLTGSCNYSWTMTFSFLFLLPFFSLWAQRPLPARTGRRRALLRVLFLLLSFVAGAYSENGSLAMLCAAFGFLLLSWRRDGRLPPFLCAAFGTACAGFLFLMLAPSELNGRRGAVSESTLAKTAERAWALLSTHASAPVLIVAAVTALAVFGLFVWILTKRRRLGCWLCSAAILLAAAAMLALIVPRGSGSFTQAVLDLLSDTKCTMLLALCLYLLLLLRALEAGVDRQTLVSAVVLGGAALVSVAVFLFAVYFPARSACPFITYLTLADALLLQALWDCTSPPSLRTLALTLGVAMLLTLPPAVRDIDSTYKQALARDAYLRWAEINRPGETIVVDPMTPRSKYAACWPGDEDHFRGEIAVYYNIKWFEVSAYVNREEGTT